MGGTFFVNLESPQVAIPFVVSGSPGVPGAGSLTFQNLDLSTLEGTTLVVQLAAVDTAGLGGGVISNGLRIVVDA